MNFNKYTNTPLLFLLIICFSISLYGQDNRGSFSGSFEGIGNFFLRDSAIDASGTPQYDRQLFGAESWLELNYAYQGFNVGMRFDLFNNSNRINPQDSYTDQGIGRWFVQKKIYGLGITVGHIWDQIGSGAIFRSYEERALGLDNALYGARLTYDLGENWQLKAFTGRQKNLFDTYDAIIKGGSAEGFLLFGNEEKPWSIAPGIGILSRTLDDATMTRVVQVVASYVSEADRIPLNYNNYLLSINNTLSYGNITWYLEGAFKSKDIYFDPEAPRTLLSGATSKGKLENEKGSMIFSTISWADKGIGVNLQYKRTQNFEIRVDPLLTEDDGLVNFLPPMFRQNTYQLKARYAPATLLLGEQAYQAELSYAPSRKLRFLLSVANIANFSNDLLYRELDTEVTYKYKRLWTLIGGIYTQWYNQEVYEGKPDVPMVRTVIPYIDFLYRFTKQKSIRVEAQYLQSEQAHGTIAFGLLEFGMAPHWSFELADQYNFKPVKGDPLHFPRIGVNYTYRSNRISMAYVKQQEGIVCTGGICRLEPAFSGVKLTVKSTF